MNRIPLTAAAAMIAIAFAAGCGGSDGPGDGGGGSTAGGHGPGSTGGGGDGGTTGSAGGDTGGATTGGGGSGGTSDGSGWVDKGSGVPDSPVQKGKALACTVNVGSGSGQIQITPTMPQAIKPGDVICIAAGTYDGMSVKDLDASGGAPITIQNAGAVKFTGVVGLAHLANVTFSGAGGTPGSMNGNGITMTTFQDAIDVSGKTDKLTIQNIDFIGVGRIAIQFLDKSIHYDGTDEPLYTHLAMKNLTMKDTAFQVVSFSPFLFMGTTDAATLDDGTPTTTGEIARSNLARYVEIANCDIQGGQPQEGLYLGNVFDVDVHHVRFQHVNIGQIGHIEMILLSGNGRIHHNYVDDYRGMVARVFPIAWDAPGLLDIYDNIALDGQWYSDYEVNPSKADIMSSPRAKKVDTRIYGNSTGNLATVQIDDDPVCQDYQAVLVDDYLNPEWYDGKLDVRDNVVYRTLCPSHQPLPGASADTAAHIISPWLGHVATFGNNVYFDTYQDAGFVDSISAIPAASSALAKAGAPFELITHDFFGRPRDPSMPTIGAVEAH